MTSPPPLIIEPEIASDERRWLAAIGEQVLARIANEIVLGTGVSWEAAVAEAKRRIKR